MAKFNVCKCFYTDNYFVRTIKAHMRYENDEQFQRDYSEVPAKYGVSMETILSEVKEENQRRLDLVGGEAERRSLIASKYIPLHKDIFSLREEFFDHRFLSLLRGVSEGDKQMLANYAVPPEKFKLYQFPVFSEEFCRRLLEEVKNFQNSDLPQARPNTMNYYGTLLDEIGFKNFFDSFRSKYLSLLASYVYPEFTGNGLDSHRAFTVSYKSDKKENVKKQQLDLAEHYDNAEVTLNVSLNTDFEGGEIYFNGVRTGPNSTSFQPDKPAILEHKPSWGIFHIGRQLHGALPIEKGSRHNLILWMRSSSVRNSLCPRCWRKPTLTPSPDECYGDGFTSSSNA